jgi:predicted O-methyltransferase YrrM
MDTQIKFEEIDCDRLNFFDVHIKGVSEMIYSERLFLNGIIRHFKPTKLLEVGIAAGGSSALILNAIQDIPGAMLYSHDYNSEYYREPGKPSGFVVHENCAELANKWKLMTGGLVAEHLDSIGGDIDFVLLDTMHSNPGEFLDFLMILPYLRSNAIVVIHDISLHMGPHDWCQRSFTCGVLFSALRGLKIVPESQLNNHSHDYMTDNLPLPNIGAVILDSNMMSQVDDIFRLLSLSWEYQISDHDLLIANNHFKKHYGDKHTDIFIKCASFYQSRFELASDFTTNQHVGSKSDRLQYKKRISILGIPLLKIVASNNTIVLKLLGILPFLKVVRK